MLTALLAFVYVAMSLVMLIFGMLLDQLAAGVVGIWIEHAAVACGYDRFGCWLKSCTKFDGLGLVSGWLMISGVTEWWMDSD